MSDREELRLEIDAELAKSMPKKEAIEVNEVLTPTEDNTSRDSEDVLGRATKSPTSESDSVLDEAIKMGYNPNYEGPNKKTPDQFVRDGSFFRKIDSLKKENEETKNLVKELVNHNNKIEQAAYNKGLNDALARRRDAIQQADVEAFEQAEQDLQKLTSSKPLQPVEATVAAAPVLPQMEVTQDMRDWVKKQSSWFNKETKENERMVIEADGLFTLEAQYNPNKSQAEILDLVETKMKRLYPDKFSNPNQTKPAAVSRSSLSTNSKGTLATKLNDRQKNVFKQAKAIDSSLDIENYARQLDNIGELKND